MGILTPLLGKHKSQQAAEDSAQMSPRGQAIVNAIQEGVMIITPDGIIRIFNSTASKITGWGSQEAVGLDYHSAFKLVNQKSEPRPEQEDPFVKIFHDSQAIKENSAWILSKEGKLLNISLTVAPVVDDQSQPTGSAAVVFRDITEEQAEAARRSEFISTASHEMRTPLTAIEGYLALAMNDKISKIDDNAKKYLEKASRATKDLGVLFQDLLTSSKAEDGRLASYPVVVELGEIIEQVIDGGKIRAKEKGLDLQYVISSDNEVNGGKVIRPLFYCYVDPHRIKEVVQNIIDNAIKYTISGGVAMRLTGDAGVIQIQVQDSGQGIPEEDIPHLFQKFYRVDSSLTRSVGGTGLGLFICKKIVELYNGQIWVESTLGKGSTFFINLPRLSTAQALEAQKKQASTISPLDTPR
jgi:PAS domain S-box-containing protein